MPRARLDDFADAYRAAVRRLLPRLADNPDYTAIINTRQLTRLRDYLDDARSKGARVLPLFEDSAPDKIWRTTCCSTSTSTCA